MAVEFKETGKLVVVTVMIVVGDPVPMVDVALAEEMPMPLDVGNVEG